MASKLERFTQRARRVLSLAQEEAERMQHSTIDTEHLLIGLVREGDGIAAHALRGLGVKLTQVIEVVENLNPAVLIRISPQLDLSSGTKKVLELAIHESRRMGQDTIGTEHLLLGLVRQTTGNAIQALKRLGINSDEVRREVRRVLQEKPVQPQVETETTETEQVPTTSAETILEMLGKGTVTPEQAAMMIEQSTATKLLVVQMSMLDLIQTGRATVQQIAELMKPLHIPFSPLFIGVDTQRQLHITVTSDENVETEFTLTAAQFQEVVQQVIASLRAGSTGTLVDRPISLNKRIRVKVDKKQGGENPDVEV